MATLNVETNISVTRQRFKNSLMRLAFPIPGIDGYNLSGRTLTKGETLELTFKQLLFCAFSVPTLIRLTVGVNTLEVQVDSRGLLLPFAGRIVIAPAEDQLELPLEVTYVAV